MFEFCIEITWTHRLRCYRLRHGEPQKERSSEWLVDINVVLSSKEVSGQGCGSVAGEKT
jgi:hypothetical protein